MAIRLSRCVILHVPKTGSDWVRSTCHLATPVRIVEIGEWHSDLHTVNAALKQEPPPWPFLGTFVRHPLDWYKSAWVYWKETGRFPRPDDSPRVECDDFEQFVTNCMTAEPTGYVSTLYERFTGPETGDVSFIGRQETLQDDLIRLLKLAGEPFNEEAVRESAPRNVRGQRGGSGFPGYSFQLAWTVLQHEHRVIARFY